MSAPATDFTALLEKTWADLSDFHPDRLEVIDTLERLVERAPEELPNLFADDGLGVHEIIWLSLPLVSGRAVSELLRATERIETVAGFESHLARLREAGVRTQVAASSICELTAERLGREGRAS